MKIKSKIMDEGGIAGTFRRLAHQIIERNEGTDGLVIIGIRTRGVTVASRVKACLDSIEGVNVPMGVFDIALYRDDLEDPGSEIEFSGSEIAFGVDGKTVLLCDDVLYTGRTARSAIAAVLALGRPKSIQLLILVDRGHRELPFQSDYTGKNVPTSRAERVVVHCAECDGEDSVRLIR